MAASLHAVQRLLEPAEGQQLLAESQATVDQLGTQVLEIGVEPDR